MPKRKEPELDPKEQFKRFVEAAREHGVPEDETTLDDAFTKVVPHSNRPVLPASNKPSRKTGK